MKPPILKIKPSTPVQVIEILGWLALAAIWVLVLANYPSMPDIIPTHFNAAGNADDYGNKSTIFLLPIIATVVFVIMTVVNQFPHIFNNTTGIKPKTEEDYTNATRMLRYLKLAIALVFLWIIIRTTQTKPGQPATLGAWFLPVTLALILIPVAYFIVKILKMKK